VETQQPQKISTASVAERRYLEEMLNAISLETLKKIPLPGSSGGERPKNKAQYLQLLTGLFAFSSLESFDAWISLFPPLSQEILRDAALFGCVVLEKYEAKNGGSLVPKKDYYSYWEVKLEPSLNLGFLWIIRLHNQFMVGLPGVLREVIRPWFAGPPEVFFEGCLIDEPEAAENSAGGSIAGSGAASVYNNALEIAGSFPLLCEALPPVFAASLGEGIDPKDTYVNIKPFAKKHLAALRTQCGFKPFPEVLDKAPDALDLAARFILCMTNAKPKRPEDGQEEVKKLVHEFFGLNVKDKKGRAYYDSYQWDYIESHLLIAHLKKKSLGWGHYWEAPPSRKIFLKILVMIAKDGRWFSVPRLARCILINENAFSVGTFSFVQDHMEDRLCTRAVSITVDGITFKSSYGEDDFSPIIAFRYDLLIRPLLSAYCYLFAALGLLEITQKTPPEPVTGSQGKTRPFSPYDALEGVRITGFGRWCLGLTEERPDRIQEQYEAIADRELLLVTVRGSSFERTLYLDAIGERLGEDRWRVSPRSFIAGCAGKEDIAERISKFKRLIDKNPAPHWEALFSRALERAGFLNRNIVPATVYYLGDNRSLIEELLNDPSLGACALRAEGRMLVVPDKYRRKFLDFLAEHGIVYA
jgi:hypothetical protein